MVHKNLSSSKFCSFVCCKCFVFFLLQGLSIYLVCLYCTSFASQPKKYSLVQTDSQPQPELRVEFSLESTVPSRLPSNLQALLQELVSRCPLFLFITTHACEITTIVVHKTSYICATVDHVSVAVVCLNFLYKIAYVH